MLLDRTAHLYPLHTGNTSGKATYIQDLKIVLVEVWRIANVHTNNVTMRTMRPNELATKELWLGCKGGALQDQQALAES